MMGSKDIIGSLFWLIIGIMVSLGSVKLHIGQPTNPGPGFMSFYAGILLIILSLLSAVINIRKSKIKTSTPLSLGLSTSLIVVIFSFFGCALVFKTLGYLISIGLFVFVLFKITAPKKWFSPLLCSIGVVLGVYLVFSLLLQLNFPRGIFNLG